MTIGEFLKEKRKEKGLSLRQLAYKIKLSHTNIADIEKGVVKKESSILRILGGLNLTSEENEKALELLVKDTIPEELQDEVLALKKTLIIQNNHNNGDVVIGKNEKHYYNSTNDELDLSGLDEKDIEDVKKYIEFLKSKKLIKI